MTKYNLFGGFSLKVRSPYTLSSYILSSFTTWGKTRESDMRGNLNNFAVLNVNYFDRMTTITFFDLVQQI